MYFTGWTYIDLPAAVAHRLKPDTKITFRVKGKLDNYVIKQVAVIPMGNGNFIIPLNSHLRRGIKKQQGDILNVQLEVDTSEVKPPDDFIICLKDDPSAADFFNSLTRGHQNYFTNWIKSAGTEQTKEKRIAQSVNALARKMGFGEMLRALKARRNKQTN